MDDTRKTIFAPLQAAILAQEMDDSDLLELIGGFAGSNAVIAQAMLYHARDFLRESDATGQNNAYGAIICEVYRRTFFDPEYTVVYGTQGFMPTNDILQEFANHLTQSFAMDNLQADRSSFLSAPEQRQ